MLLLLLLTLPAMVQAQFNYTTNNGAITITGYTGPGGAVTIPDTITDLPVTSIGHNAFSFCVSLTSVTIPNSVTTIGYSAFDACTGLANITIGTNVTSIGDAAFHQCTSLTSVTIGKSVTNIGLRAFGACANLTAITVDPANTHYSDVAGVLFSNGQTTLVEYPGGKAGSYTIPGSVTSIADYAFHICRHLTSLTIPNGVTSIGYMAFESCSSLTNATIGNGVVYLTACAFKLCTNLTSVTIPNSVTRIEGEAFASCGLTSVTIPSSVTEIGGAAFAGCPLISVYCQGNAPNVYFNPFGFGSGATVYYLPGTTGWGPTLGGCPTVLWDPPIMLASPPTQTAEANSAVNLRVWASGASPLFCVWYFNDTNVLSCSTNRELALTSVQFSQSGAYTVVISNVLGAVTSAPAMLNVIAPVERRPVPGVKVTGETGSLLNVDYANFFSPAPNWTTLGSVSLTSASQYWFDLTLPLPPQRYYRARQTGTPGVRPSLDLHLVPAITLLGNSDGSVRVDAINQFGPIDGWVTLATVTLTNTSQLYFDVSSIGQPPRLWRIVPVP